MELLLQAEDGQHERGSLARSEISAISGATMEL
jgi:hypothetical protein